MFDNITELAENKLIILYIFDTLNFSISNNDVTEIVLKAELMGYFTLQQYLSELVSSECLCSIKDSKSRNKILITKKGKNILHLFIERITPENLEKCNAYFMNNLKCIEEHSTKK